MGALSGFTDTGITFSCVESASLDQRIFPDDVGDCGVGFGEWGLTSSPMRSARHSSQTLTGPFTLSPLTIHDQTFPDLMPDDPLPGDYWGPIQITVTHGPYRLGVALVPETGHESDRPLFVQYQDLTYNWFGDRHTRWDGDASGTDVSATATTRWLQPDNTWGGTQSEDDSWSVNFGTQIGGTAVSGARPTSPAWSVVAKIRGWNASSVNIDTSGLEPGTGGTGPLKGLGGGDIDVTNEGSTSGGAFAAPDFVWAYNIDLPKFGDPGSSGAQIANSNPDTVTVPYASGEFRYRNNSWVGTTGQPNTFLEANITDPDTTKYPTADRRIWCWGAPALVAPNTPGAGYTPATIKLDRTLDLIGSGEHWASSDTGKLTVTGQAPLQVSVSDTGAYVERTVGTPGTDTPSWRPWLGVGTLGHGDPSFNPDRARITKHAGAEDVWAWDSYRYLWLTVSGPTASTLTLRVQGVYADCDDPHTTGSDRYDNFAVSELSFDVTFDLQAAAGGLFYADLLFPQSGGPFYLGRVDRFSIHGLTAGNWTISNIKLACVEDPADVNSQGGQIYAKVGHAAPVGRKGLDDSADAKVDYSWFRASPAGCMSCGVNVGDTANKGNETDGATGGGLRYVDPLTGFDSGEILDQQKSLRDAVAEINGLEGWTSTYDPAAYAAVNTDAYGNSLGPEVAQWMGDGTYSFRAGQAQGLDAIVKARTIIPVNAIFFGFYSRMPVLTAVDAVVTDQNGKPVPDGTDVSAGGVTTHTSARGYALFPGIPTGTTVTPYTLTVRDMPRVPVSVVIEPKIGCDMVICTDHIRGMLARCWKDGSNIYASYSHTAGETWEGELLVASNAADDASPTICRDRWNNLFIWFHTDTAAVAYRSLNIGDSWEQFTSHAGLKWPRMAVWDNEELLLAVNGDTTTLYLSADFCQTLTLLSTIAGVAPGLAALGIDRFNHLHILYTDAVPQVKRVWSRDGVNWSEPVLIGQGRYPSFALASLDLVAAWWDTDGNLFTALLEYDALRIGYGVAPPRTFVPGYMGTALSRHHLYGLLGQQSGVPRPQLQWARDPMQEWFDPY